MTLKAAAAAFSVSPATADRWWHRWLRLASRRAARCPACLIARAVRVARRGSSRPSWSRRSALAGVVPAGATLGCRGHLAGGRGQLLTPEVLDDLFVDLDPEPGSRGRVDPSADVVDRRRHEVVLHRVTQRLELEELAARRAEGDGEARCAHDRRGPGVSVRLTLVGLDAIAHLLEAGDSLGPPGVHADHVDGARREDPFVPLDGPLLLAVRNRSRRLAA